MFNFLRNWQFSKLVVVFYIPINSVWVLIAPYPFSVFGIVSVFNFSHFCKNVMMSLHCGLSSLWSDNWWCWASFHLLTSQPYSFLYEVLFKFFAHFLLVVFLLFVFKRSLYILDPKFFFRCAYWPFIPVCSLPFYFLKAIFWREKKLIF